MRARQRLFLTLVLTAVLAAVAPPAGATSRTAPPKPAPPQALAPGRADLELVVVEAPILGTFYRASAPEAAPFVALGDVVKTGDVLCIIEAMKLMNDITSECDGEVVEIFVESGQPVQYGDRLFAIRSQPVE